MEPHMKPLYMMISFDSLHIFVWIRDRDCQLYYDNTDIPHSIDILIDCVE